MVGRAEEERTRLRVTGGGWLLPVLCQLRVICVEDRALLAQWVVAVTGSTFCKGDRAA